MRPQIACKSLQISQTCSSPKPNTPSRSHAYVAAVLKQWRTKEGKCLSEGSRRIGRERGVRSRTGSAVLVNTNPNRPQHIPTGPRRALGILGADK